VSMEKKKNLEKLQVRGPPTAREMGDDECKKLNDVAMALLKTTHSNPAYRFSAIAWKDQLSADLRTDSCSTETLLAYFKSLLESKFFFEVPLFFPSRVVPS
jgi:hypothetical protein